ERADELWIAHPRPVQVRQVDPGPCLRIDEPVQARPPEEQQHGVEDQARDDETVADGAPPGRREGGPPGGDAGHASPPAAIGSAAGWVGASVFAIEPVLAVEPVFAVERSASSGRSTANIAATTEKAEIHSTGIAIAAPTGTVHLRSVRAPQITSAAAAGRRRSNGIASCGGRGGVADAARRQ